jgi:hypothetical protein
MPLPPGIQCEASLRGNSLLRSCQAMRGGITPIANHKARSSGYQVLKTGVVMHEKVCYEKQKQRTTHHIKSSSHTLLQPALTSTYYGLSKEWSRTCVLLSELNELYVSSCGHSKSKTWNLPTAALGTSQGAHSPLPGEEAAL